MAQQSYLIEYSQERFDLPDFNSLQSFIINDFQALNQGFITDTTYVCSGLIFQKVGAVSLNMQINIPSTVLFNSAADGTMYVAPGTAPNISLTVGDGATTYVWLTLGTQDTTPAIRTFWDPTALNGQGAEFQKVVNTVRTLTLTAHTSTVGFPVADPTVIYLAVVTAAAGNITSMIDHRPLLFRLGKAGAALNASYTYPWPVSRTEPNPNLLVDALALTGADKQLTNLKVWMDAVMSQIKEIKFGGSLTNYWFEAAPGSLSQGYVSMTDGGIFNWNLGTNSLSFTLDITFLIPNTPFVNTISHIASSPIVIPANNDVVYVNIDRTANTVLVPVVTTSAAFTPASDRIIIVRRTNNAVYVGIE